MEAIEVVDIDQAKGWLSGIVVVEGRPRVKSAPSNPSVILNKVEEALLAASNSCCPPPPDQIVSFDQLVVVPRLTRPDSPSTDKMGAAVVEVANENALMFALMVEVAKAA